MPKTEYDLKVFMYPADGMYITHTHICKYVVSYEYTMPQTEFLSYSDREKYICLG